MPQELKKLSELIQQERDMINAHKSFIILKTIKEVLPEDLCIDKVLYCGLSQTMGLTGVINTHLLMQDDKKIGLLHCALSFKGYNDTQIYSASYETLPS